MLLVIPGALVGLAPTLVPGAATAGGVTTIHPLAGVFTDSLTHRKFGVVPAIGTAIASPRLPPVTCNADNGDCTLLSYHNGPVQHAEKDYLLFWTPSGHAVPSAYKSGFGQYLTELAAADYKATNPLSVTQQYYDLTGPGGTKNFVSYDVSNGGTLVDTDPYPASGCTDMTGGGVTLPVCITDAQIRTELASYVAAHSLPKGIGVEYFVMTPNNVGSCFDGSSTSCSYTSYCGYHSFFGSGATQTVYADMPWAYGVEGCDVNLAFGAGYANADAIDPVVGIFSHELSETMTDPNLNAWYQANTGADAGSEIGDKCAYNYGSGGEGSLSGLANNGLGYWNVALSPDEYLLQMEFSNHNGLCEVKDTDSLPATTITIVPNPPVHGSSAAFTANITGDPNTPYTVHWTFGDGGTATTNPAHHTYAAAGHETLTVIVTDSHGSETKVTETITVS
jgi:hypothetical protein